MTTIHNVYAPQRKRPRRVTAGGAWYTGKTLFRVLFLDGRLRRREAGDRHAEGGAGDIIQADLVAELHGGGDVYKRQ